MSFYAGGRAFVRAILKPFFRIRADGLENVPQGRGYLLACNHVSDWDPVILGIAFPNDIHYMAKEELFHIPVLGSVLHGLGAFPVSRGKGDTEAIGNAVDIVKSGGVLGIFPEGTRFKDGKLHKMKSGAVVVASQTGGGILPAAIQYGERRFLRRQVTVTFGVPISNCDLQITERSKSELRAANALLGGAIAQLLGVEAP